MNNEMYQSAGLVVVLAGIIWVLSNWVKQKISIMESCIEIMTQEELLIRKKWLILFVSLNCSTWLLMMIKGMMDGKADFWIGGFLAISFFCKGCLIYWRAWIKKGTWLLTLIGCLGIPVGLIILTSIPRTMIFLHQTNGIKDLLHYKPYANFVLQCMFVYFSFYCWRLRSKNYAYKMRKLISVPA